MTTRIIAIFAAFFSLAAFATKEITLELTPTTGRIVQTGKLVAGSEHAVTVRLTIGAWYDAGVYRVTLKRDGAYDETPYALVAGDDVTVSGANMTFTIDLGVSELYDDIGSSMSISAMFDIRDADGTYAIQHRTQISNSVYRPSDTVPAGSLNAYWTAAETQAAIDFIDAGVSPIGSPIAGYYVESTDAGQIQLGDAAGSELLRLFSNYSELTTLATGDHILIRDATDGVHKYITLQTLLDWINTNLPQ